MSEENLQKIRHSLAHILAAATRRIYGEKIKFGVGPAIKDGFYYDIDFGDQKISESDLKKIEKEMRKIIAEKQDFLRSEKNIDDAIALETAAEQDYKVELLNDLKNNGTTILQDNNSDKEDFAKKNDGEIEKVSFYTNGEFTDLCRGGHISNTAEIDSRAFRLTKIAGAYWRGNEKRPMMTRIYGVAFANEADLAKYFSDQEEAQKRDHRKLGKELDLFVFSDLVGAGLPIFTPRGTVLREEFAKFSNELREKRGFQKVWTPHITKTALYEKSGHFAKFGDELFLVKSQETDDNFVLKPMNCPHHTRIFASRPRSYRDLPVRLLETTTDYRDEKTGELGGLSRVRSLTQDDSHVFCRRDQIESEIHSLMTAVKEIYETIQMKLRVRLSWRDDSDAYLGDEKLWESAQNQLKKAVIESGLDYFEQAGEAAFYGPKIDFMATDALGREHQLATAQLDFVQPERFSLEYTDENGEISRPVMIHCALLGSIERFLSVYIEHVSGRFPVWCAPEQLRVIKVKDSPKINAMIEEIREKSWQKNIRIVVDDTNNSVSKKIRLAEKMKTPYSIVIGEKESESGEISVRSRADLGQIEAKNIDGILNFIGDQAREKI